MTILSVGIRQIWMPVSEIHPNFRLNGMLASEFIEKEHESNRLRAFKQLIEAFTSESEFTFTTSGTTGPPKQIVFTKNQIAASARATHKFFGLNAGSRVGHVLPLKFVAGKMMLYRALLEGYHLVVENPEFEFNTASFFEETIDFMPVVPLQLQKLMVVNQGEVLSKIDKILIGGASIPQDLLGTIQGIKTSTPAFYESFGSTETLTHIAVKNISIGQDYFEALPNVSFQTKEDQLIINAPNISTTPIITNDCVELLSPTAFIWLGRKDNIINSGGVKLFPEVIETKLQTLLSVPFFVAQRPSKRLGSELILIIEGSKEVAIDWADVGLDKFEVPKAIFYVERFERTISGKISREKTLQLI